MVVIYQEMVLKSCK